MISNGENDILPSFFQEYKLKLENLCSVFYTEKARELAKERQHIAREFYNSLYQEANLSYQNGKKQLDKIIQ